MKADNKRKATLVHVILQLTIFIFFMKAKVTSEMVEGCIESQLTLSCDEAKVINISSVVLGDSSGCSGTDCCPKNDSCTAKPSDNHVNDVHRRCNGRSRCAVNVIKESISCGTWWFYNENNDFERIVYDCIDNGNISTFEDYTDEVEYTSVTETSISEEAVTSDESGMLNAFGPAGLTKTLLVAVQTKKMDVFKERAVTPQNSENMKGDTETYETTEAGISTYMPPSENMIILETYSIALGTFLAVTLTITLGCGVIIIIVLIYTKQKSQVNENSIPMILYDASRGDTEGTNIETDIHNRYYEAIDDFGVEDRTRQTHEQLVTGTEVPTYLQLV